MNVKIKPCYYLEYCPYGALVEYFPHGDNKGKYTKGFLYSRETSKLVEFKHKKEAERCRVFGHDCPVYYMSEDFTDYSNENERNKVLVTEEL